MVRIIHVAPPARKEPKSMARSEPECSVGSCRATKICLSLFRKVCAEKGHSRWLDGTSCKAIVTTSIKSAMSSFAQWWRAFANLVLGSFIASEQKGAEYPTSLGSSRSSRTAPHSSPGLSRPPHISAKAPARRVQPQVRAVLNAAINTKLGIATWCTEGSDFRHA